MNAAMTPTVARPRTAKPPPTAATMARLMLLIRFIEGPMIPARMCARVDAARKAAFATSNSAMVCSSRT